MWRSRTWPRRPPYQASSARSEVPQAGSRSSRKVRRLERMRRRATRLWWTRSTSLARRRRRRRARGGRAGPTAAGRPVGRVSGPTIGRRRRRGVDQLLVHVVQEEGAGGLGQHPVEDHARPRVRRGRRPVRRRRSGRSASMHRRRCGASSTSSVAMPMTSWRTA